MISFGKSYKVCEAKELEFGNSVLTENGCRVVKSIKSAGTGMCYDIMLLTDKNLFMDEPNFVLGNGIISHNCNLPIIDKCIKLIKENRGIEVHKSDIPIDDHESIKMGTRGELLGIFQFENPYTKKIADKVGCDCLGDIAAITSLIRPGPKDVGLDIEYAERKNGKPYERNPILEKVMGKTYGVLTFQEQIQKLAIEMAGMSPLKANALRKASSKKKVDLMEKLKPEFIQGSIERCVKTGIMTEDQVNKIWELIESMASYSFNKCLLPDTVVETKEGFRLLGEIEIGDFVNSPSGYVEVVGKYDQGEQDVFEFTLESGKTISCTLEHKFLCSDGIVRPIKEILERDFKIVTADE